MADRLPYRLIEDFLDPCTWADLRAHALASEDGFEPTVVWQERQETYQSATRQSWKCAEGLGPVEPRFAEAVRTAVPDLLAALGMAQFPIARIELELVAHRNGGFFAPHLDTLIEDNLGATETNRLLSMVYYLHAEPRRFGGGELVLHEMLGSERVLLDPRGNVLVAFPSFVLHEVLPVICPAGDVFADARFTVNCWIHRGRKRRISNTPD